MPVVIDQVDAEVQAPQAAADGGGRAAPSPRTPEPPRSEDVEAVLERLARRRQRLEAE